MATAQQNLVYYVTCEKDDTVLVAMDLEFDGHEFVTWFDTVRERGMRISTITDKRPGYLTFERHADEGGGIYTFIPLTLEDYTAKVKSRLADPKDYSTLEELYAAFQKTKETAW